MHDSTAFRPLPGAKIGHVANHINNDISILPQVEVVVVVAGHNMRDDNFDDMKEATKSQADELAQVLKPLAEIEDKHVFLVDPVNGFSKLKNVSLQRADIENL